MSMRHDLSPKIVFVRFEPRDQLGLVITTLCLVGVGALIIYVTNRSAMTPATQTPVAVALTCFLCAVWPSATLLFRTFRWLNMRAELNRMSGTRRRRRRTVELMVNLRKLERGIPMWRKYRWQFDRALRSLQSKNIPLPICIVDAKLRSLVRKTQRTGELIECEPVGQTLAQAGTMGYFVSGLALMVLPWALSWIFTGRGWSGCAFIIFGFVGLSLFSVSVQRWYVAGQGSLARARGLVVGPGAAGSSDYVWTASQCLTVIRLQRGSLFVTVLDRSGKKLSLKYLEKPPESFADFWQRWMHPKPRPDLVAASVGVVNDQE